jgi:hypothetical protein
MIGAPLEGPFHDEMALSQGGRPPGRPTGRTANTVNNARRAADLRGRWPVGSHQLGRAVEVIWVRAAPRSRRPHLGADRRLHR